MGGQRLQRAGSATLAMLGLVLGAGAEATAARAAAPRTVCSVTLHSEDEIATLRARLPADEFRFVELTGMAPTGAEGSSAERSSPQSASDDWLGAACRSGIQCDVLVVSGHFGGSFFGSSGRTLGLADLEAHACRNDCPGVLSHPREVFLLGCNTAASKQGDQRSAEQYLRTLRDDGLTRRRAERIVESRYGALGASFRARMQRVFAGVPHVYGFGSVAPAGPTAARALGRYLDSIEGRSEGTDQGSGGSARGSDAGFGMPGPGPNRALARAFEHTSFVEFAGMRREGEAAARRELVCSLYDEERPAPERLEVVEAMARDPAFLSYVPSIERFFDTHPRWSLRGPRAEASLARLERLAGPRAALLARLEALRAPTLRSELADVAASLGWLDASRQHRIARQAVIELIDREMGPEERAAVCELAPQLMAGAVDTSPGAGADLSEDELDPETFADFSSESSEPSGNPSSDSSDPSAGPSSDPSGEAARYAAQALLCLEPRDPALRRRMAASLDDPHWSVRARALETLTRLGVDEPRAWAAARRMIADDPRAEVRAEAARALARRPDLAGPDALAALVAALHDPEPAVRAVALRGLGSLVDRPGVATTLAGALADGLADGDWQVQFAAASALGEIAQSDARLDATLAAGVEPALERALDAPSWFVRYKAAETLARLRPGPVR